MPSPTRGPHLSKLWEPKVNYLVTKPEKHYNLLAGAHYGIMIGALVVVVVNSWTMQTRTSWGQRFNLDGDMLLNPRYSASEVNNYTTVVTSATWAFLMFFSFSCSVLVGMCTHGASVRTVVQATVFESALDVNPGRQAHSSSPALVETFAALAVHQQLSLSCFVPEIGSSNSKNYQT